MGLRFPTQVYGQCFFVTSTFKEWCNLGDIDGFYEALADSLIFYTHKYKAHLLSYVLMPSHIHLILAIAGNCLSGFMRDFKKYIAQKVARDMKLGDSGLWMPRFDRVVISSEKVLQTKLQYIHCNPVKNVVGQPEDWEWSSAADYILDKIGRIPIFKDWM